MTRGRVLMISEHADPLAKPGSKEVGGQNVYVHDLAKELGSLGWSVDVYTRWDNRGKKQVVKFARNCRVIRIKSGPRQYVPRDHLFEYLPEFVDNIVAFKTEHNLSYDIIHAHYWMSGWSALKLGQLWAIPVTTTYHSLGHVRFNTLKLHKDISADSEFFRFRVHWEKEIASAGKVLSTSPFEKKDLLKYYGAPVGHIKVIPAGIDLDMFKPVDQGAARKKIHLPEDAQVILYAGRLEWRKGIATLIYSIKDLITMRPELKKTLRLVVVGRYSSGPERNEYARLKQIAEQLRVKKYVHFAGSKDRSDMKYYYSAANVCAVPSYYEPFGLVPLEAFACCCPVVASKVGGLQFTVRHNLTGQLVKPRRPKQLAKALAEVLLKNADYKQRVKDFAGGILKEKFSWEAVAKEMDRYYSELRAESN